MHQFSVTRQVKDGGHVAAMHARVVRVLKILKIEGWDFSLMKMDSAMMIDDALMCIVCKVVLSDYLLYFLLLVLCLDSRCRW